MNTLGRTTRFGASAKGVGLGARVTRRHGWIIAIRVKLSNCSAPPNGWVSLVIQVMIYAVCSLGKGWRDAARKISPAATPSVAAIR